MNTLGNISARIERARAVEDVFAGIAISDGLRYGWGSWMHRTTVDGYLVQRGERLELQALFRDVHSIG